MTIKLVSLLIPLLFSSSLNSSVQQETERYKVGLCIVATGKYIQFVEQLVRSADCYLLPGHEITYFVFTDGTPIDHPRIIKIAHKKLGWPYDTMMRFEAYHNAKEQLSKMDYLFALDADMLLVDTLGNEILGERVGTLHPGFFNKKRERFSYESKNKNSTAFIASYEGKHYFAGGF